MSIDPRLLERRKDVAEEKAQKSVWRLVRFLVAIIAVAALVWLALSPWLSVKQVRTAGIVSSDAHATLAEHEVVAGTPMILVRAGEVKRALESDPWISEARVGLEWPDQVIVRVTERVPVVWVESSQGWSWRAVDGMAVPGPPKPDPDAPRLLLPGFPESELDTSRVVRGAAQFVASLPGALARGLIMKVVDGELWASTETHDVRLGRPVEMEAKALSLAALMRESIPDGARIILVAPTHPAVEMPGARETEQPAAEEGTSSGTGGSGDD